MDRTDQTDLTLVEWKYTESSYGACRGFSEEGDKCSKLQIQEPISKTQCYLTQGRNKRRYWEHTELSGIDIQAFAKVPGCPFRGPAYQLWRQYLLAAYCRETGNYNKVEVASISFSGNKSLHQVPDYLASLGSDMLSAWKSFLIGVPKLRHVNVEDIVDRIKTTNLPVDAEWVDFLKLRYGL